jgi:hypothetical protein
MKKLNALQMVTRAPRMDGPHGMTTYLIPPERMAEAGRLADCFEPMRVELQMLLDQYDHGPNSEEAQRPEQVAARAILATLDRKETPCPETPTL